jgi:hypothetical protein
MTQSKTALVAAALLPLMAAVAPANANTLTYDFNLSCVGTSGCFELGGGSLTVSTSPSGDIVTGITGSVGGEAITGLLAPGSVDGNDNVIFPNGTPTVLSLKGLGFELTGGAQVDLLSQFGQGSTLSPGEVNLYEMIGGPGGFGVGNINITPVPLPASWGFLALGIAGLGALALRSKKSEQLSSGFASV